MSYTVALRCLREAFLRHMFGSAPFFSEVRHVLNPTSSSSRSCRSNARSPRIFNPWMHSGCLGPYAFLFGDGDAAGSDSRFCGGSEL